MSVVAAIILISGLPAFSVTDENPLDSPLNSVSYTGRFSDVFSNPAALGLMETDPGLFALALSLADSLSGKLFGSDPKGLYDLDREYQARVYTQMTALPL